MPEIVDLTSARAALAAIVEQGEGRPWTGPGWAASVESAHYHRFLELKRGHRYAEGDTPESGPTGAPIAIRTDAIRVMRANPRLADHEPGTDVRVAQEQFNQQYCALLALLERVFDGEGGLLAESVRAMHRLGAHGEALMEIDDPGTPYVAGPTFEYVPRADRR